MAVAAVLLAGCEKDEEYARSASYGSITFSPESPYVGDTVTMTVEVLDPGHRIFHADYTWSCNSSKPVAVTAPDGAKTIKEPPTYKHVFTKAGTTSVNMSAKFKFSMATREGSYFGSAISKSAFITVREKPAN